MKHRKKHRGARFLALLIVLALLWVFGTFTLTVTEAELHDGRIKNEIRIVQLTDLHGALFGRENRGLIKKVAAQSPDLVFVTGDMYTSGDSTGEATALSLMTELAAQYPIYYVSGEHDGGEAFLSGLTDAEVHVMNYEDELVTVGDTTLHLYGIDNAYYSPTFDLANEFEPDGEHYSILLAHMSNFAKFADFGMDLTLCGDTHGGQVRIPFVGALIHSGVWLPELKAGEGDDVGYTKGLYEYGDSSLFVSSGLGNYPVPVRIFNRPEVAVIVLKPE